MEKVDTSEILPRNYCLCYEKGDDKSYFAPFYQIQGNALRTSPGVLEKRMKYAQRYNRRYAELEKMGRPPYKNKDFPWPEELLEDEPAFGTFRERVKKKEGVYTLVDASPGEAIKNLALRGDNLSGEVKSKEPRKRGTAKHSRYSPHIKGIFLDQYGEPDLTNIYCTCPDQTWTGPKGTGVRSVVECMHTAAIEQEFWERMHTPNNMKREMEIKNKIHAKNGLKKGLLSIFGFSANWKWDRNKGYISGNKHLQVLEDDARIAHYLLGEKHFDINQKLLKHVEVYSPLALNMLSEGLLTFEVIAQKTRTAKTGKSKASAENALFRRMRRRLTKYGYAPDGKYLELGRPAWRYKHGDNVVGIVFSEDIPPFYVVKQGFDKPPNIWDNDIASTDPFKLVGEDNHYRHDDKTKKLTSHRVMVPSAFRLPETGVEPDKEFFVPKDLKLRWKRKIEESNPHNNEGKLKYSRLYYQSVPDK